MSLIYTIKSLIVTTVQGLLSSTHYYHDVKTLEKACIKQLRSEMAKFLAC